MKNKVLAFVMTLALTFQVGAGMLPSYAEVKDDAYPEVTLTKEIGSRTVTLEAPEGALPKGVKLEAQS